MFLKLGLLEETKGGKKEEKNDKRVNNEIHHICVGIRHNETHSKLLKWVGEKG
jgi:hypothetical protein